MVATRVCGATAGGWAATAKEWSVDAVIWAEINRALGEMVGAQHQANVVVGH